MSVHKPRIAGKKRVLPIGWRLSLHVACISVVLCFGVLLFLLPYQYARIEQETIVEARILAEAIANIYQHLGPDQPHDYARRILLRMARMPHITLVDVIDQQGVVRYSTDSRQLGQKIEDSRGVVLDDELINISYVVPERDSQVGSVNIVIDREIMLSDTHRLFGQVSMGLLIMIIILSVLMKGLVEGLVSARLAKLMGLIENAEQGSFLIRAEVDRPDEIGHVILGFNQLLGVITQIEAKHLEKEHSLEDAQIQKSMRIKLEETLFQLERSHERLKSKVSAQELLMEAAHRLGATLKREAVVERLIVLAKEKLSWPQFGVFLIEGNDVHKQWLRLVASYGFSDDLMPQGKLGIGDGIIGIVAQTGAPILIGNLEAEEQPFFVYQDRMLKPKVLEKSGSLMAVPMIHKGRVIGAFLFIHTKTGAFDADDVTLISALAAQTAIAIVNAELYETTLELATSDSLTGVLNRRAMVKQIEFELARAQRFNTSLALLLVDVDHFKAYNDTMGHVLGDVALKEIARALKENIRKVDTVARFGGEEFCVILPQADRQAAREVAGKLCQAVRSLELRGVEKQALGHLSVSIGIALVTDGAKDFASDNAVTDLIACADKALYEAKRLGRDRFVENERL